MHERRGAIKLLSCYFVPFPNFKLQSLHFTLDGHVKYVPSSRYEAYIDLVKLLVKCTKIKPQVDCFSSCSAHVASSVAKSDWQVSYFTLKFHISKIALHFNLLFAFLKLFTEDFSHFAIFAPYQAWANALAGPCQQEGEEGEAPSHTHR